MGMHRTQLGTRAKAAGGSLIAIVAAVAALGLSGTASAAGPTMNRDWPVQMSPSYVGPVTSVHNGRPVTMLCWTGGPQANGTGKWFKIRKDYYPQATGYVPATTVRNQTNVPRC